MALTAVCFFGLLYLSVAPKELDNTFHIFLGFARAEDPLTAPQANILPCFQHPPIGWVRCRSFVIYRSKAFPHLGGGVRGGYSSPPCVYRLFDV